MLKHVHYERLFTVVFVFSWDGHRTRGLRTTETAILLIMTFEVVHLRFWLWHIQHKSIIKSQQGQFHLHAYWCWLLSRLPIRQASCALYYLVFLRIPLVSGAPLSTVFPSDFCVRVGTVNAQIP